LVIKKQNNEHIKHVFNQLGVAVVINKALFSFDYYLITICIMIDQYTFLKTVVDRISELLF